MPEYAAAGISNRHSQVEDKILRSTIYRLNLREERNYCQKIILFATEHMYVRLITEITIRPFHPALEVRSLFL